MKKKAIHALLLLISFALVLPMGCKRQGDGPQGRLTGQSGCKVFILQSTPSIYPMDNDECLLYRFSGNTLHLIQQNAAFNCCPGEISAVVSVNGRTITIKETEQQAGCHCTCLYDLELEIVNLEPGTYRIVVDEPFLGTQPPLDFSCDLEEGATGDFCLERSGYPWQQ